MIGYSGREAAEIAGITYRQLDYWARTDLLRPSLADAHGSGSLRRYSYRDLILLTTIRTLVDHGLNLERVRVAFTAVSDLGGDPTSARLVIIGNRIEVARTTDELLDIVNRRRGPELLNLLAMESIVEHVNRGVAALGRDAES